jgi:excisionase family DNA binding protein
MNNLITIKEACEIAKVSKWVMYRWIKAGTIPTYNFSEKTIRIDPTDLKAALMKKQTIKTAADNAGVGVNIMNVVANRRERLQNKKKPLLVSRPEAARNLGLGRQTLVRLEKRGLIKPFRLNKRRVFYKQSDVDELFTRWEKDGQI